MAPSNSTSYWHQRGAGHLLVHRDPPDAADYVIVGGGLAGLSTSIALLERDPAAHVVILEAQSVGFGASGRNGGLLSPLPVPVWLITAENNAEHAWALRALNARVHQLAAALADAIPESETRPCTLHLQAMGRLSTSGIRVVAATLDHAGIAYELATDADRGGKPSLRLAAHALSPYRLVCRLATAAAGRGARICEHAAVKAIEDSPSGARIRLADGRQVTAGKVVLCTNAYTKSLTLTSPPKAKVVRNYMIATGKVDATTSARLRDGEAFMVELNKSYVFYRLHQGHLVYGGIESFFRAQKAGHEVPPSIRAALERHLAKSLPGHDDLKPTTAWAGYYHSTSTDLPIIRRASAQSRILFNVGYAGTGVALTQIFAPFAASLALDRPLQGDDARLYGIMRDTRVPIKGLLRFGGRLLKEAAKLPARR